MVRYGENDVHGACARWHEASSGHGTRGLGLIEVIDLKWYARAGRGHGEGASFAIVEPLIGNSVAIRDWRLGTEVDALTAFGVSQGWEITQRLGFESNHAGSNSPATLRFIINPLNPLPTLGLTEYRDISISVNL